MPPFDPEMAEPIVAHIQSKGVRIVLGDPASAFERGPGGKGLVAKTKGGKEYPADMAMLVIGARGDSSGRDSALRVPSQLRCSRVLAAWQAVVPTLHAPPLPPLLLPGVRPETGLAKAAGLEIGARGGVRVDEHMRTSDPAIYAVGGWAGWVAMGRCACHWGVRASFAVMRPSRCRCVLTRPDPLLSLSPPRPAQATPWRRATGSPASGACAHWRGPLTARCARWGGLLAI
jgi:hypothetical protein